uniref:YdeI-like protein n=1 Tax=Shouchella clausii TaxID=79880 RepID=Q6XD72_SHOCL|nr:YdeI-like protein [Shouchella clausii]
MPNNSTNPKVDEFLNNAKKWKEEYKKLREIILDCDLTEEFKWMHPCYTFENKNIVLIHGFKDYCALLFHKGALVKGCPRDTHPQTENVQAAAKFALQILRKSLKKSLFKDFFDEAIAVEKAGLKVNQDNTNLNIPEELQNKFDEMPALKTAFEALTPGRQRAYILYFSGAKQPKTRAARVEKYVQKILDGLGLKD